MFGLLNEVNHVSEFQTVFKKIAKNLKKKYLQKPRGVETKFLQCMCQLRRVLSINQMLFMAKEREDFRLFDWP